MKKIENLRLAIVISEFNTMITDSLQKSAIEYFISQDGKAENIDIYTVPGAFEIPGSVSQIIKKNKADIIVALGCIITVSYTHLTLPTKRIV